MSLNSIRLTPVMLADFFATSLVQTSPTDQVAAPAIAFFGNNSSKMIVVADSASDHFLTDEEQTFLASILGACKLALSDVAVVNWNAAGENGAAILEQIPSVRVLLFGVDPVTFGLPLDFPPFQNQEFNKRTYLFAPGLSVLANDIPLKKQLWEALKRLFQI